MAFYQATIPPLPDSLRLDGQTAVLTGATAGIGLELSLQLLSRGLRHLIVGVRDVQKGGVTRLDLLSNPKVVKNNPNAQITVLKLDLSSLKSVAKFSNEVLTITSRLDCLILCAGINTAHFEQTGDGNERYAMRGCFCICHGIFSLLTDASQMFSSQCFIKLLDPDASSAISAVDCSGVS